MLKQVKNEKLPGLHSLRGIAALMIVFFHVAGIPQLELPAGWTFINNYFGMGVPLFFVISAFSLFLSTYKKVGDNGWIQAYFIKRFFRIAPLFYLMLIFFLLVYYFVFHVVYTQTEIFLNATFLFNLFPGKHEGIVWAGWTIGVEMLFYLLLPYLLVHVRSLRTALLCSTMCIIISIAARKMYESLGLASSYPYMSLLSQLGVFSTGIPAYFLYEKYRTHPAGNRIGQALLFCSVLLLIWAVTCWSFILSVFGYRIYVWAIIFSLLILSQLFYPFMLISNKMFVYLGEISFSLYILHPMLVYGLKPLYKKIYCLALYPGYAYLLCVTLTLTLLVPMAHLVYTYVESRSIKAGKWLVDNRITP